MQDAHIVPDFDLRQHLPQILDDMKPNEGLLRHLFQVEPQLFFA